MMRAFVGLKMSDDVCEALARWTTGMPFGRIVPPENLHLTLAFLGDQSAEKLEDLHDALQGIASPRIPVTLTGVEVFGGREPRLLAAHATPEPELLALQKSVKRCARNEGINLKRERFKPHVTLARFPRPVTPEMQAQLGIYLEGRPAFAQLLQESTEMTLFRSELRPEGARYDVLATYPFG